MAKKIKLADLTFKVSDDGTLKVMQASAKKAGKAMKDVEKQTDDVTYATKKGINATANQTKNFANLARGISGSLVPAYATLAANVFALTAVFGFLKNAADYRVLKEGQANYAAVTGVAYETLTNSIIRATDTQVTYTDAAQAAAIGTAAGLSPEQLERLGAAAKTVSIALGRDVTDSFNRLIRGVTKAEPELLDELGIILRLDPATKKYAAQLGVAKESLNAFQRTQAVSNEVLGQVEDKFNAINAIVDPNTNKINKLTKAFDDLMNQLKLFIAGPAEGLAVFFSQNLGAAIGALGLFTVPILQSILPAFDEMAANAEQNLARHNQAMEQARAKVVEYEAAQKKASLEANKSYGAQLKNLQGMAGQVKPGNAGTGLALLQAGKEPSKAQIRALKSQATRQIGIFKNMNKQMRQNWILTLNQMTNAHKVNFAGRVNAETKRMVLTSKAQFAKLKTGWIATMGVMKKATTGFAKVASKAFGLFTGLSFALLIFEGVKAGAEKFGLFGDKTGEADKKLNSLLQTQLDFNKELDKMLGKDKQLADKNLTLGMNQIIERNAERLRGAQTQRNIADLAEQRAALAAMEGALPEGTVIRQRGSALQKQTGTKRVTDIVRGKRTEAVFENLTEAEAAYYNKKQEYIKHENAFRESLEKLGIEIGDLPDSFDELDKKTKDHIVTTIAAGDAAKYLKNNATSLDETLRSMAVSPNKNLTNLRQIITSRDAIRTKMRGKDFDPTSEAGKADIAEEGKLSGIATAAQSQIDSTQALALAKTRNQIAATNIKNQIEGRTILAQKRQTELKISEKQLEIEKLLDDINVARLTRDDATDPASVDQKIEQMNLQVQLLQSQKKELTDSINLTKELGVVATEAFANSMQKGIQGVIEGTMSIKDAFKSMAQSILQSLAQVLAKMMTMKILSSMFGIPGVPMANGGIIPMAKGGIIKGYQHGGIAREPTYLVGEAGPEAVVPLPDGRSIPVNMSGATGNNITINVDASGQSTTTMDGERGKQLGVAIQAAVMETLQREKRPGGVLSGN